MGYVMNKATGERYTVFEYIYRDAGNLKTAGSLLLTGTPGEAEAMIRTCLNRAEHFVAEQVGVPSLCPEHFKATGVARMRAASGRWDVTLSPNRWL